MPHLSPQGAATIPADDPERDFTLARSDSATRLTLGWWETRTQSLWPAKIPPVATVSSTCTFHPAVALRLIVMISRRCSQSWKVKSRLLSEGRRPSFEPAKQSTFQRTHLTNSKTRAGNRRDCYACARLRGKKSFSKKSAFPSRRGQHRHPHSTRRPRQRS
jgi:hypothetical protein